MKLPTRFYRVAAIKAGDKLRYAENASKTYADKEHALERVDNLHRRGIECVLYESEPVVWHDITPRPPSNDPELPLTFN